MDVDHRMDVIVLAQEVQRQRALLKVLAGSLWHSPICSVRPVGANADGFGAVMVGCDCGCDEARLAWAEHSGLRVQRVTLPDGSTTALFG